MKKAIVYILLIFNTLKGISQHIPDANFAQAIRYQCPDCIDDGNRLTDKAQTVRSLTVSIQNITDLEGIAGFTNLTSLNCTNNKLTKLPKFPVTLNSLNISYNAVTALENLPTNLTSLKFIDNKVTVIPILPTSLLILNCSGNPISELPTLPPNLNTLFCENTLIKKLPAIPAKLEGLICNNNNIKNIPKLSKTLIRLSCQNNPELTCLPLLPESLLYLDISKQITCLPNAIKNAEVNQYDGISPKPVSLPICTSIQMAYCPPLETDNPLKTESIQVFPNPTEGELNIKVSLQNFIKMSLFNMNGKLMIESNTPLNDISFLAAGLYFIKIETNDDTFLAKIVRQ